MGSLSTSVDQLHALTSLVLNTNSLQSWPMEVFNLGNLVTLSGVVMFMLPFIIHTLSAQAAWRQSLHGGHTDTGKCQFRESAFVEELVRDATLLYTYH